MKPAFAALVLACHAATPALADCAWEWLCNGEGACKHMPVCDSVEETPRPENGPAAVPPLTVRPRHARGAGRARLSCETIMRLAPDGRWTWHEACYCSDKARNPDASRPFAHIVRCAKAR